MQHGRQSKIAQTDAASEALPEVAMLACGIGLSTTTSPSLGQVRKLIEARRLRAQFLGEHLFADPAWDILLQVYATQLAEQRAAVQALCAASTVPETTALRWIRTLEDKGLLTRYHDADDRAGTEYELSPRGHAAMAKLVSRILSARLPQ